MTFSGSPPGRFRFDSADPADDRAPGASPHPGDELLADVARLREEWDGLLALCPAVEHRLGLRNFLAADEVTIDAGLWPAIVAVGAGCSVVDLGGGLGLSELGCLRMAQRLL